MNRHAAAALLLALWLCVLGPSTKSLVTPNGKDAKLDAAKALRLSIKAALQPSTFSAKNAEAARSVAQQAAVLEQLAPPVAWKNGDLQLLNGTWDLLYTSNGEVDRGNLRQLGVDVLEKVQQEIDVKAGRLRNVLTLSPWPSSKWPLGPLQGVLQQLEASRIVLRLDHRFEAYGQSRLRIVLEKLDRSLEGPSLEGLAALIPRSSRYDLPLGPAAQLGAGRFDTTVLQGDLRISRGAAPLNELRIFQRKTCEKGVP